MMELLRDKKAIFFDVGYTLDYPTSGDWMLTGCFTALAGARLRLHTGAEIERAKQQCFTYLNENHLVTSTEAECAQYAHFYRALSDLLDLRLTDGEVAGIAHDRTYNMKNYTAYPEAAEVVSTLSQTHILGIISDTWPSIEQQLESLGLLRYFSATTYSCMLGVFKPHPRMFEDALSKIGCPASDTVFIDDRPQNLAGAAAFGITPILIAADPAADVPVPYRKIHSLRALLS